MKKKLGIILCVLIALLFSSCMTTYEGGSKEILTYKDEKVEMKVAYEVGKNYICIDLKNKTSDGIVFITDYATCAGVKLVFGETRLIDSNKSQPVVPIAPNGSLIENKVL